MHLLRYIISVSAAAEFCLLFSCPLAAQLFKVCLNKFACISLTDPTHILIFVFVLFLFLRFLPLFWSIPPAISPSLPPTHPPLHVLVALTPPLCFGSWLFSLLCPVVSDTELLTALKNETEKLSFIFQFLQLFPCLIGKARQLYLYSTFHTQGRLKVLHIETLAYNQRK